MKDCPRCGQSFICGVEAGTDSCWCADLPPVMPLTGIRFINEDTYQGCLCPDCLRLLIEQQQQQD